MATLSDLVDAVAETESMDRATVNVIARSVRENGLIATHGRGLSAAKMTVKDGANLLIGVNAASTANRAGEVVPIYRKLEAPKFVTIRDSVPSEEPDEELDEGSQNVTATIVRGQGTFGEALEALIDGARDEKLAECAMSFASTMFQSNNPMVLQVVNELVSRRSLRLWVRFEKPNPSALISFSEDEGMDEYRNRVPSEISLRFISSGKNPSAKSDRTESTTISFRTIHAVGQLVERGSR